MKQLREIAWVEIPIIMKDPVTGKDIQHNFNVPKSLEDCMSYYGQREVFKVFLDHLIKKEQRSQKEFLNSDARRELINSLNANK